MTTRKLLIGPDPRQAVEMTRKDPELVIVVPSTTAWLAICRITLVDMGISPDRVDAILADNDELGGDDIAPLRPMPTSETQH